jgi:hypothetical protein
MATHETTILSERLETAVAGAQARVQRNSRTSAEAAFRARVEERLKSLDGELADVKSRLNGLYLVIASTVLAQVLLRIAT